MNGCYILSHVLIAVRKSLKHKSFDRYELSFRLTGIGLRRVVQQIRKKSKRP